MAQMGQLLLAHLGEMADAKDRTETLARPWGPASLSRGQVADLG